MNPEELSFAATHEWVHVETEGSDKIATVGISAFATEQLGDLVFLDLPEVGKQLDAGGSLGEVESVKSVSDIYSPVAGEVIAANDSLREDLETLSSDPFGEGWLVKIKVTDDSALEQLMDHAAYQKQCEEEG